MTHLHYTVVEAFRNFRYRPISTLGAIVALALLLLLLDLFWISARTVDAVYVDLVTDLQMEAFVADSLAEEEIDHLNSQLSMVPGVQTVSYISRQSAREELVRLTGIDLLSDTTLANPLPRSFVLSFRTDSINTSAFEEIEKQLRTFPAIQQVNYSRDWLINAESTRSQVHRIGVVIGALIAVAALLNLANNIRLMSRTSAVGIRQARLMGAGKLFLSSPYIFEGFLIGGVAAVMGWIALFYFQQSVRIAELQPVFPVVKDIIWFCLLSAVIGGVSGLLGVRSLLKW